MEPSQITPWKGAASTDARNNAPCPRCGEQPGDDCKTPGGKHLEYPHGERMAEFARRFPNYAANEIPVHKIGDIKARLGIS